MLHRSACSSEDKQEVLRLREPTVMKPLRFWNRLHRAAMPGPIFIRAQDINTGRLRLDDLAHVNLPARSEGTRTRVFRHDILVTITGANVTKSAFVDAELDEAYVSQHVALIRPVLEDTGTYLYNWIVSPVHGRKVRSEEHTSELQSLRH